MLWRATPISLAALQGIPPSEPVVLLAHEPDFATQTSGFPVDLQLSGHSHGGQVRLPFLGAPVLPPMAQALPLGTAPHRRLDALHQRRNRHRGASHSFQLSTGDHADYAAGGRLGKESCGNGACPVPVFAKTPEGEIFVGIESGARVSMSGARDLAAGASRDLTHGLPPLQKNPKPRHPPPFPAPTRCRGGGCR